MSKLSKISFIFGALCLISMTLIRYLLGEWVPFCWVALGLSLFFILFACYWDRKFFISFLSMKTTKQGMSMGVLILLVIVGLGVVNFLSIEHYKTFDFSLNKMNSISLQSIQTVSGLTEELKVIFFYKKGVEANDENRRVFKDLIKKYQDHSKWISLDFVEVNERPDIAKKFGVDKGSGVVFVSYKDKNNRIEKIEEQEMTNAFIKVTRPSGKTVYFTSGHGELDLEEMREAKGLNAFKLLLSNNQYTVKNILLTDGQPIPKDADMIIVAGPTQGFQSFEVQTLKDYLRNGGGLLLALESQVQVNLEPLLKDLGVKLENNFIVNVVETALGRGINQGPTLGNDFSKTHSITRSFQKGEVTLFRYPSAVSLSPIPALSQEALISTSKSAAAFNDLSLKKEVGVGPFNLAVNVHGKFGGDKESIAVVVGDSDFLTNQMLYQNMNRDLALNMVSAVARDENMATITAKEPEVTRMNLSDVKFTLFLFGFIIPFPLLFLGLSIGLWTRRRNA